MTEAWATENLYCWACDSDRLAAHTANRAVEDYHCLRCARRVQLKAKNGRVGATVRNSAYAKKRAAILAGRAPDYCFMGYDRDELVVDQLLVVPGHFITLSVVSECPPLRATAKRAGWVGSNIHLSRVPESGRITIIEEGVVRPMKDVRSEFTKLSFVGGLDADRRTWLTDVLACVEDVAAPGKSFTNEDVYSCEAGLASLHPKNRNIRPKIRQQLQVLERAGVIRRRSAGLYERL